MIPPATLDMVTRAVWIATRLVGVAIVLRCWQHERQRFYLYLAASWLFSVAYAVARLATDLELVLAAASVTTSVLSSVCGLIGFARLARYLRRRIATVRTIGDRVVVRRFDPEDERDTVRPPALR